MIVQKMIEDLKAVRSAHQKWYAETLVGGYIDIDDATHAEEVDKKLAELIELLERGPFCEPA
jgi:hypothetical protein